MKHLALLTVILCFIFPIILVAQLPTSGTMSLSWVARYAYSLEYHFTTKSHSYKYTSKGIVAKTGKEVYFTVLESYDVNKKEHIVNIKSDDGRVGYIICSCPDDPLLNLNVKCNPTNVNGSILNPAGYDYWLPLCCSYSYYFISDEQRAFLKAELEAAMAPKPPPKFNLPKENQVYTNPNIIGIFVSLSFKPKKCSRWEIYIFVQKQEQTSGGKVWWSNVSTSVVKPLIPSSTCTGNKIIKLGIGKYRIKARAVSSDGWETGWSDWVHFSVQPKLKLIKSIKVIFPNGHETLYKGKTYTIKWTSSGIKENVKIILLKGGKFYKKLTPPNGVENTGSYSQKIPNNIPTGSDYKIKVSTLDNSVKDESNSNFTIE